MPIERSRHSSFVQIPMPPAYVLVLVLLVARCAAAQPPSEYEVKAAFLLNFTRFVTWPPSAFETPDSPLTICILGDDPFGGNLDQLVEGETAGNRRVVVRRVHGAPAPKSCQIVFVGRQDADVVQLLAGMGSGVLTVGEGEGFLRAGGMIAFVVQNRHVRFDINQRAAMAASLTLSARLLAVARSVQT